MKNNLQMNSLINFSVKFSASENNHVYSIFMGTNFCGHGSSVFLVSKLEYIFFIMYTDFWRFVDNDIHW